MTVIDCDPRELHQRYRLYRQRGRGRALCVASSPDPGGIGEALVLLATEGELLPDDRVGVLDSFPNGEPSDADRPGTWLISPYAPVRA